FSMLRISIRCYASAFREILGTEKANIFMSEIDAKLAATRGEREGSINDSSSVSSTSISYWEGIRRAAIEYKEKREELRQLEEIINADSDDEMVGMAKADLDSVHGSFNQITDELARKIIPRTEVDVLSKCQMEFSAGAGGTEAMIFTAELFEMYRKYSEWRGWIWTPLEVDEVSLGGMRAAIVSIQGKDSYASLRFEAGVHRVQRIPLTDKSRMHTSTSSIAVLPEPEEVSVLIPPQSVTIETMRASGPGGQNVNKRSSAVRMTHKETGISVHVMDERFQHMNMQIAYKRLAAILMQQRVDKMVEKFTSERKLQVGSKARAEKIRTYNFKDDRISDHRLHLNMGNIVEFMRGNEHFDSLVNRLNEMYEKEKLNEIINNRIFE
ncbi:hypothetical protein PFISCL1PPCAC_15399, partial [Pristionchus fissidentatus]